MAFEMARVMLLHVRGTLCGIVFDQCVCVCVLECAVCVRVPLYDLFLCVCVCFVCLCACVSPCVGLCAQTKRLP